VPTFIASGIAVSLIDVDDVQFPREVDQILRRAITEHRLIRFWLDGHERVAEPHDYGIRKDAVHVLVYQVAGTSKSGPLPDWRWVRLSRATGFELLDRRFPGGREREVGRHAEWDRLFLRVAPAGEGGTREPPGAGARGRRS
jgi:hypothetical protein